LDIREVARRADVDVSALDTPDARILRDDVGRLWREAIRLSGDVDLGLHAGEHAVFSANNWLTLLTMTSESFFEGIQAMVPYQHILGHARVVEAERVPTGCKLSFRHVTDGLDILPQEIEFLAVGLLKLAETVCGEPIRCEDVGFRHPCPGDSREHERVFGTSVHFGADEDFLIIPSACAFAPSLHRNPRLRAVFEDAATRRADELRGPFSLHVKVAAYALLAENRCTIENAAHALGMSVRTLQRRLSQEGVAFRGVVRECKLDTAVRCLEAGFTVEKAARRAGFTSRRAFDRAFREWTGTSPMTFVA
jgi:AraC-like DNA-binding protein